MLVVNGKSEMGLNLMTNDWMKYIIQSLDTLNNENVSDTFD